MSDVQKPSKQIKGAINRIKAGNKETEERPNFVLGNKAAGLNLNCLSHCDGNGSDQFSQFDIYNY